MVSNISAFTKISQQRCYTCCVAGGGSEGMSVKL